jgi:hypothetical protein
VYKTELNRTPATSLFPSTQISTTKGYGAHGFIKFILLSEICGSKDCEICWARRKYGGEKMDMVFCCRSLKEKDHLENLARDGEIMIKCNLKIRIRDEED